ncbi:MAG: LysE family transporter [Candidatus Hadarchaeales archaeon]
MLEAIVQLPIGFIIALSGALIPGPLLAYVVVKTLSDGGRSGAFAAVGHVVVELAIVSIVALGLGFAVKSQALQTAIGVIGGLLLVLLGGLNLSRVKNVHEFRPDVPGLKHHAVIGGVLFSSVLNPSVFLWWSTVGLAMLTQAFLAAAALGAILWLIGHFLADLGWYSLVSYSIAKGRWLIGTRAYKGLLLACGAVLLLFGAYFLVSFVPRLIF